MILQKSLFIRIVLLLNFCSAYGIALKEQLQQTGYVELCQDEPEPSKFNALYEDFDQLIEFLQTHPNWTQKLYQAKERFIRSKDRPIYSTDFFGFYDESLREQRRQISFYYCTHFHEFINSHYPEFKKIPEFTRFFETCRDIQKSPGALFTLAAAELGLENLFSLNGGQPPILFKVIKYLPSYVATRSHYDGTLFTLLLDSTEPQSLLLSPYKSSYTTDDFHSPIRQQARGDANSSFLLIPGTLLTEFSIYPTPHIVAQTGQIRYASIAFCMKPYGSTHKNNLSPLPNFKD